MQPKLWRKIPKKHLFIFSMLSIGLVIAVIGISLYYKTLYEKEKRSAQALESELQTHAVNALTNKPLRKDSAISIKDDRVSIHARQIPVQQLLEDMAKIKHKNIILSSEIKGSLHLNLEHLKWDEAFYAILQAQGLEQKNVGLITFIGTQKERVAKEQTSPLQSSLIPIKYGKAADYLELLKNKENTLLSERGNASVDSRTNTLWLLDTPSQLKTIEAYINALDHPVKQVMIEARIVNIDSNFEKNLGLRLGLTHNQQKNEQKTNEQNFHVDLLQNQTDRPSEVFGLALFRIAPKTLLDLELSALEAEGKAKIISSPHIITTNQQEASIESGEDIPYQLSTKSGATAVTYKKAALSLKVLPQITPNNKIILTLQVNQDRALFTKPISGGIPVQTRQITSQVLINNGETIVIGGIYEQSVSHGVTRLPILGNLPLLGALFRKNHDVNNRQELIIFVTPHIVEEQTE